MAVLLAVLASGRKKGYTASLMDELDRHLADCTDVTVETLHLHDFSFGPCKSCFSCIRSIGSGCVLDDDWGRNGSGFLFQAFRRADALMIFDSVHQCCTSAMGKLFMERIYPLFWEGITYGLPFASVSCASNQGFQDRAQKEYCTISSGHGFRYIGGVAAHTATFESAKSEVRILGGALAEAAVKDERDGRHKLSDRELFEMYNGTPWNLVSGYLANITRGTYRLEDSYPAVVLKNGGFRNVEAQELLLDAYHGLDRTLKSYHRHEHGDVARECSLVAKYWANATFKEFLEQDVIRAPIPPSYRNLEDVESHETIAGSKS